MLEVLNFIPVVGQVVGMFAGSPEASASALATESGAALILLELLFRRIPSKKRRSVFLAAKKIATVLRATLELLEKALELTDSKLDHLLENRQKD